MKTNAIKYSKNIFAFLDILGFRSIVNESRINDELVRKIADILKRSQHIALSSMDLKPTVLEVDPSKYMYRAFSDTILISGPYTSHHDMSFISMWVMINQYYLWKEEQTFIRGAMVYGDVFIDKDIVFGPALIDAYDLERTKAVWPRVLIDKSLLGKFTETELKRDFLEFIRQDTHNVVYLDYLREIYHLFLVAESKRITGKRQQDFGVPTKLFEDHKEAIYKQLSGASKEENQDKGKEILRKYLELSEYHNSVIDQLRQVIKDIMNNSNLIAELFHDQIKSSNSKKLGLTYKPKYSAEEHLEQADMLNILGTVLNRIIERHPADILETLGIVIIGQTENVESERIIRTLSSEAPQELSMLDKTLQESIININSLGLQT